MTQYRRQTGPLKRLWNVLLLLAMISTLWIFFGQDVLAADPTIFGNASEADAKQRVGSAVGRIFEFILWLGVAAGLIAAAAGVAMSNGFIGDASKGQQMLKSGVISAVVCGLGVGLKSLFGYLVG